jgi:hypothetical protein
LTKLKGISTGRAPSMTGQKMCLIGKFIYKIGKNTEKYTRLFKKKR